MTSRHRSPAKGVPGGQSAFLSSEMPAIPALARHSKPVAARWRFLNSWIGLFCHFD
jgi:hypothetical protein